MQQPPDPSGHAVFIATRDPRARADHGRMQVVRTALDALRHRFGRVDVVSMRSADVDHGQDPEGVTTHPLPTQPVVHKMIGKSESLWRGHGSLNAAIGLSRSDVTRIAALKLGKPDLVILDGVRSLPAMRLFPDAAVLTDLDDLLSDRYRAWSTLPFDQLPFDIFGTQPSSPVNAAARRARALLPPVLRLEAGRVAKLEEAACRSSHVVSLVSATESARLRERNAQLSGGSAVVDLPMAVPAASLSERIAEHAFDGVFLGRVTHLSNLAGLQFLADAVVPAFERLQGRPPRIAVVGKVTGSVETWLIERGLEPLGFVDDLSKVFDSAACAVAPQVVGGGVNTKILDYGLPPDGLLVNLVSFNVGVEIGQLLALWVILLGLTAWRKSGRFDAQARAANTVLMALGFLLIGHQLSGYFAV